MGGGGKGGEREVYDFLMSLDYGICHGPVNSINAMIVKDKTAFAGIITENSQLIIDQEDLFGGDEGEGGLKGVMELYLGGYDQLMSSQLASRFGDVPKNLPGYRGLVHVFFRGEGDTSINTTEKTGPLFPGSIAALFLSDLFNTATVAAEGFGFRWTSNNPYLPPPEFHVTCGWNELGGDPFIEPIIDYDHDTGTFIQATDADRYVDGVLNRRAMPDINPSHMLYALMTNKDWGKGDDDIVMNTASYINAAAVLKDEMFGLSMMFSDQDSVENFSSEILDHIKAAQFQDPRTGEWTLKLFRDDYGAVEDLDVLDQTNCEVVTIKERTWGEVINHIRVTYTDPVSEESEAVTSDNPSVIAIQGGSVSETRDYYGIRNAYLAQIVADRDVAEASRILTSIKLKVNREAFDKSPGDVMNFVWPEENITQMAVRITGIDWGSSSDRQIVIEATEDVYSTPQMQFVAGQQPTFTDEDQVPTVPDQILVTDVPLPMLTRNEITVEELDDNYPQTGVMFLVNDQQLNIVEIITMADVVQGNGSTEVKKINTFVPARNSNLGLNLIAEVSSVLPAGLIESLVRAESEPGEIFLIGSEANNHEIVMLDTYDDVLGQWTVIRGVWDTVPVPWTSTDRIWRLPSGLANVDSREVFEGDELEYFFRPRTTAGTLSLANADQTDYTAQDRPHAPFRPANCEIGGQGFGGLQYLGNTEPAAITCTWVNRNRTSEDAVANAWDEVSSTPETGQTTTIRLRDSIGGEIDHEYTGITGTTFDIAPADFTQFRYYDVEFIAVRDGIESFMYAKRSLEIERTGWNQNWDSDWSENDG